LSGAAIRLQIKVVPGASGSRIRAPNEQAVPPAGLALLRSMLMRSTLVCLLPFTVALGAVGCAFRTPTPNVPPVIAGSASPPAHLRVSEVTVVSDEGNVDPETVGAVRDQTVKILADAARKSSTGGGSANVRVRVHLGEYTDSVETAMHVDGLAVIGYFMAPAGLTFERQKLSVDVAIERGGRAFTGHGEADKEGSIYARARKRALAVALDEALSDAACAARAAR
jgi:hypothetical protein